MTASGTVMATIGAGVASDAAGNTNAASSSSDNVVMFTRVIFVNTNAQGINDGSSWVDAFNSLQSALDLSGSGDQIWVASGTYYPSVEIGGAGALYLSFPMKNGVSLYGGFYGTEASLVERDWQTNVTLLSGQIDEVTNCYHVIYSSGVSGVLDGFSISGGDAGGEGTVSLGGGMYNENSTLVIGNCTFFNNYALAGGALYNYHSASIVTNCIFSGNTATHSDYMYCGGAVYNEMSDAIFTNCIFTNNTSYSEGGAVYNEASNVAFTNCLFYGNSAYSSGAAITTVANALMITNCTFYGNTSELGGTINNTSTVITITNTIVWGNNTPDDIVTDVAITVTYSNIEDGYDGDGNFSADPLFSFSDYNGLNLTQNSPCIDSGTNVNAPLFDIVGQIRPYDGNNDGIPDTDVGAYEWYLGQVIIAVN